jgi:hypothetical protein
MMDIFKYLTAFDVDDFDIRHSPTGGFHATYLNELSSGDLNKPDRRTSTASTSGSSNNDDNRSLTVDDVAERYALSHASIVNESLFMSKIDITHPREESPEEYNDGRFLSTRFLSTRV